MINIKRDFPILQTKVGDHPLVWLDSASTSQKPRQVLETMDNYYQEYNANIHRSVYSLSEKATLAYEATRKEVAKFIGANPSEIVFTRGATEAINLVVFGFAKNYLKKGDAILLTEMEHHANLVPWQVLAREKGLKLKFIPLGKEGKLDLSHLDKLLAGVKLLSFVYISNVLGTINPVEKIVRVAKKKKIIVCLDGAQAVGHRPVDVEKLGVDFLAFSGHKMLGPTGTGVLWAKREHFEKMRPLIYGGDMIEEVRLETSTFQEPPAKFEAGTPNIAGIVGLGEAIKYLRKIKVEKIVSHDEELTKYALGELGKIKDLTIYGPPFAKATGGQARAGVISFNLKSIHPHDVAQVLGEEGICVRSGHHCAMPLHRKLGIEGSVRASFYLYNTKEDIDKLVEGIKKVKWIFTGKKS